MIVTASQNYIRVSPQKVKYVADSVRKMPLVEMKQSLSYLNKEAARKLLTTLNQALANASHNYGLSPEQLQLDTLLVLRGPQYKRMRARSRGQGHPILKRTTHIVIKLKSIEPKKKDEVITKEKEVEAKVKPEATKKVTAKKPVTKKATVKKTVKKTKLAEEKK